MSDMPRQTPLAIIGMACRLPGGDGLDAYWQLLSQGDSAVGELPPDRLDRSLYYDPRRGVHGKTYSTIGAIVSDRPFDAAVCPLPEALRQSADACHLNLCEIAAQACRHAGLDPFALPLRNTGVYVGHSGGSPLAGDLIYSTLASETVEFLRSADAIASLPTEQQDTVLGEIVDCIHREYPSRNAAGGPDLEASAAASLIARAFALEGPHMAIDAACASSLAALKLAAMALDRGTIDMAIVGGASFNKATSLVLFSQAQSCSATASRPFDADADGLVSSEGYVAVLVKTLDRALADGDTVHAVIRGIGMSTDGRGRSLWAPRAAGQLEAVRRAYGPAADPRRVQYIETHATSTQLGDATEIEALAEFFADVLPAGTRLPIGSVKSNFGHTLETAGLAGLLKVVLAMREGVMPPTINVRQLNKSVDWQRVPLRVATEPSPWPEPTDSHGRTAAVNAFGIGGLNVHVVIEQFRAAGAAPTAPNVQPREATDLAVAVIGRGAVLPAARNVAEFQRLLASGVSGLSEAPAERWHPAAGKPRSSSSTADGRWTTPTRLGGFIREFVYDWMRHKIPPKQVATTNPLQFMLLDAADQAIAESGYDRKPFDRRRAAIVVGTVFGGDFCNQLQVALHLPEFRRSVARVLARQGFDRQRIGEALDAFEAHFLERRPALFDESGSFTSSTLASRISKTYDWMGGAMAIDAGAASSLAALAAAADLLASGSCDMVLCAGAQRSMDLPTYEHLALQGLLSTSPAAPFASSADGFVPGEGVAMLLLKRLADAQRDGDRVLAVIDGIGAAASPAATEKTIVTAINRCHAAGSTAAERVTLVEGGFGAAAFDVPERAALDAVYGAGMHRSTPPAGSLAAQIGHTQAAHGLASVLKASLIFEHGTTPTTAAATDAAIAVTAQSNSGLAYHAIVAPPSSSKPTAVINVVSPVVSSIVRFGAPTPEELHRQLTLACAQPAAALATAERRQFTQTDRSRLAIVIGDRSKLEQKLRMAREAASGLQPEQRSALEEQGIYFGTVGSRRPRVALLFPGQGSQYQGMLRDLTSVSSAAAAALEESNAAMRQLGYPTFAELAWGDNAGLGSDPWITQLAVLLADTLAAAAIVGLGIDADVVSGHSFGEFAALVASGSWTLTEAARGTRARSDAIVAADARGALVSTNAPPDTIVRLATEHGITIHLANFNTPTQTVFGGVETATEQMTSALRAAGFDAVRLAVPAPFHTPMMAGTCAPLSAALASIEIGPPCVPVLSSVGSRYMAEPDEIRAKLVAQMTEPVRFVRQIERLADEGVSLFIEAGPHQVLTRLVRQILAGRDVAAVAVDRPRRDAAEQLDRVRAAAECRGALAAKETQAAASVAAVGPVAQIRVEHFDATAARRNRRSSTATTNGHHAVASANGNGAAPSTNGHAPVAAGNHAELETFLVGFVVEHTGYPQEIVELDADLEADLGIDSIKKAQLFGELREHFVLPAAGEISLADFPTLRHVLNFLVQSGASRTTAPTAMPVVAKSNGFREKREPDRTAAYELGFDRGRAQRIELRRTLRLRTASVGNGDVATELVDPEIDWSQHFTAVELDELRGVAAGAGVHFENIVGRQFIERNGHGHGRNGHDGDRNRHSDQPPQSDRAASAAVAARYVLQMADAPQRVVEQRPPEFCGASIIVGDNELADLLAARIERLGNTVHRIRSAVGDAGGDAIEQAATEIDRLWDLGAAPHLFIVTPHDPAAATNFGEAAWHERRAAGVLVPYFITQRWMKHVGEAGLMSDATLVACTTLGGDFGLSGKITAVESGAIAGLLKSIVIESWMNGFRTTPIKVIDTAGDEPIENVADAVFSELAVTSYDMEIGYRGARRQVVRAVAQPAAPGSAAVGRPRGTWVCTGGARGITAFVARQLALRYGLKLHLIGAAPEPQLDRDWRGAADNDLKRLKASVMQAARAAGCSPVDAWQDTEKQLEIDGTLRELAEAGIDATYYSCDVANRAELAATLDRIRRSDGPIDGILHGAGVGKDARFDRKQREKVEKCFAAKIDGAAALMELTRDDPLRWFIAFGSISGRFGANGHTDYSAANDMLAKQIDWFRRQRPECSSVAFHWHAWGDIGMATKPETRLALELIGMQFMPAAEGLAHLVAEIEAAAPDGEVLITDDRYYRAFFPAETLVDTATQAMPRAPLLGEEIQRLDESAVSVHATLDPAAEPFLVEHRLEDRPLLPVVIGMELLCEAAAALKPGARIAALENVEALSALRFHGDEQQTIEIIAEREPSGLARCRLLADVRARNGRLLERGRAFLQGTVEFGDGSIMAAPVHHGGMPDGPWQNVEYAARGAKFYLGPPLQRLRKIKVDGPKAWGKIAAPALVELAGVRRLVIGWTVPSALLDACLYATGLLAWSHVQPGASLPVSFGRIDLYDAATPGETCLIEVDYRGREGRTARFDFVLTGSDGRGLLRATDYRIAWIST